MKKLLSTLTLVAITATLSVSAAESQIQNYVNKKLAPITQKEKELNSKIEAQKKADAQKKAAYEKKQAEQKAAMEKAKKDAEARQTQRKQAVEKEINYWKNLGK